MSARDLAKTLFAIAASLGFSWSSATSAVAQSGPARCPTNFWVDPATGEARCLDEFRQLDAPTGGFVALLDRVKTCTPFRSEPIGPFTYFTIDGWEGDRCIFKTYLADGTFYRICRLSRESLALRTGASEYEFARAYDERRAIAITPTNGDRQAELEEQECEFAAGH